MENYSPEPEEQRPEPVLEAADASEETPPIGKQIKREVFELAKMVLLFVVLFLFVKAFVFEGYEVQGSSMSPTLQDGERILVLKLPHVLSELPFLYRWSPIDARDIVVFNSQTEGNKRYIKRIVAEGPPSTGRQTVEAEPRSGTPTASGVQVELKRGSLYVNNQLLKEEYLQEIPTNLFDDVKRLLIPGEYYVLGDNRSNSKDSRNFGPITDDQIIGRAVLRFWPLSKFGFL